MREPNEIFVKKPTFLISKIIISNLFNEGPGRNVILLTRLSLTTSYNLELQSELLGVEDYNFRIFAHVSDVPGVVQCGKIG